MEQGKPPAKRAKLSGRKKGKHHTKPNTLEPLNFKDLTEGLRLLGLVKEVHDYRVMMSLPNGLLGVVSATAVSQAYTRQLQAVAEATDTDVEMDVASLKDLFKVGDAIPCRVLASKMEGGRRRVDLSVDPKEVNKEMPLTALKAGSLLYGSVASAEEHGFMIDLGIPSIQAFLQMDPHELDLPVGKSLWCLLETEAGLELVTGETRVVRVSVDETDVQQTQVTPQIVKNVDCLRPGMKVSVTVEKVLESGLRVKCFKYSGSIYKSHVPQGLSHYAAGQELEARVLYIHPVSKSVSLTLLPGVIESVGGPGSNFADLSVGETLDDAEVLFVDKTCGVYFRIQQHTALAYLKQLSDKKVKDVNKSFPRGSKHRCRITGFHPADDVVLVSLKESVLQEKYLTVNDIHPGQIVECKVHQFHASGLIVMVGKDITGLVPRLHTADVPLKHIEKKFAIGDKLKCRVLKVDIKKNNCLLSNKRSLVTSSLTLPSSYDGLSPGMELEGWIKSVKDGGVVVSFCSDVTGWVPKSELSTVEISNPASMFYPGQVVRCRVLSCQPANQRLKLSLIISGKAPLAGRQELMKDFEAGKLMKAKVVKKVRENLEVKLLPGGTLALLPKNHLADSVDNQELLWRWLEPGQIIGKVMLYKQTNVVIVTKKESFVSAAREGLIPKSFADIEPGKLLPGVVKNHQTYGIFVELPGGLSGLVPRKFTMDHPIPDLPSVFACGQSVVVKVIEVKQENSRFLCSLRMCDCFHDDPSVGLELLETFLGERAPCLASPLVDEKTRDLHLGSIILVEVTKAADAGYLCQTDWGMVAILTRHHTGEADLPVGKKVEAVVLHVDPVTPCVEVSADRSLVQAVSRRVEKSHMDKAHEGQRIKADVVLVKEDFIVVALKQHASGTLAYMPTKQHLNDVLAKDTVTVGEETHVIVQKSDGNRVMVNFESRIPEAMAKKGKFVRERHDLQLGQTVTAQVQTVYPNQINITIGNVSGRVHVAEVADEMENGMYAFSGYKRGQEITVKVIGYRHSKSQKYLPISHPNIHKAMPECTLKPSKLKRTGCAPEDLASFNLQYKKGDRVTVFPIKFESNKLWVNVSPTVQGVISVFDLSRDLGVLQHAEKNFLPGHGYRATVLSVEKDGLLHLSLTGIRERVRKEKMVTGKVTSVTNRGIFLRLPDDFRGCMPLLEVGEGASHMSDVSVGMFVRCRAVTCTEKEKCVLSMGYEPVTLPVSSAPVSKTAATDSLSKRKRKRSRSSISEGEETDSASPTTEKRPSLQLTDKPGSEPGSRLQVPGGFLWEEPPAPRDKKDTDSDSDGQEEREAELPKKKKKNKSQTISQTVSAGGETQKDYDKLLLSRPNDSLLWIEYMSEHLNAGDIDRARSVGEQALKTISFREEQDKLNVWIALLNLENLYGSKEQVTKTFQQALQSNDPLMLYRRVAAMYNASGKMEEAEQTYQSMVRKFKQMKQVWVDFGLFLYKNGRLDAARNLLQRALQSLDRRDHVDTIGKFAQMEFTQGDAERGATMFEKIIAEFPRRSDIMSVYIDMVIKSGDLDRARELFERATSNMKNAKFFFKKYLTFEEKYGTDESVDRVKDKIESYC